MTQLQAMLQDGAPVLAPALATAIALAAPRARPYAPALLLLTLALTFWFGRWDGEPRINAKFDATTLVWGRALVRRALGGGAVVLLGLALGAQRGALRQSLLVVGPGLGLCLSGLYLGHTLRQAFWSPTGFAVADLGAAIHLSPYMLAAGLGVAALGLTRAPPS